MRRPSFQTALITYAGLALLAGISLRDPARLIVIVVMAAFALKTWIGVLRERQEEGEEQMENEGDDFYRKD